MTSETRDPSAARGLLRLAAGGLSLTREQLVGALRTWERSGREPALEGPSSWRGLHLALGLCLRTIAHAREVRSRGRRSRAMRAARAARDRLGRTSLACSLRARAAPWVARARDELFLAEALGRMEEREGRALARSAAHSVSGRVFERLGDDPELRSLVASQSATMTTMAVEELRTAAADADSRVESMLHRWFSDRRARLGARRIGPSRST